MVDGSGDPDNNINCYGLDDLFTIKDYQTLTVCIPRADGFADLSIDLLQSPAACTDPDLTGQILWPVSRLLSYYLAAETASHLVQGKNIVELGAGGTALPSIAAFYCGANTVVATDGNEGAVLDLLHTNIRQHQPTNDTRTETRNLSLTSVEPCTSLSSRKLLWGRRRDVLDLVRGDDGIPFVVDVVIAADVVQWPAVLEPLLHTVKAILWRDDVSTAGVSSDNGAAATDPVFLLGLVPRATSVVSLFFQLAESLGFTIHRIPPEEYLCHCGGVLPSSCQEYGGRTTELYKLHLRSGCDPPILLNSAQSGDCLVGNSFEQTSFLPC